MSNQSGHGPRPGGGPRKHVGAASNVTRIPVRANSDEGAVAAFVLGGNTTTLAFASALLADEDRVSAHVVPLAQTPLGTVLANTRQNLTLDLSGLLDWIDANFPAEDELSFVPPVRDLELLARINWRVEPPLRLDDENVLNLEDLPEAIAAALVHAPEPILSCAACRRLCVRDHFLWKDRALCAWDYHRQVFGKRGPWRNNAIEERHFETLPAPAYVAPELLEKEGADVIMAVARIDDEVAHQTINAIIGSAEGRSYIAVRTPDGYSLVRER
ncbi:MAG: hypothetical protein ABR508_03955 [Candidatus Baltobacteraceae bacterium]